MIIDCLEQKLAVHPIWWPGILDDYLTEFGGEYDTRFFTWLKETHGIKVTRIADSLRIAKIELDDGLYSMLLLRYTGEYPMLAER